MIDSTIRPWYRIHWSTLSVLAIVLAWLIFINIPGDPINALWSNRFYHGWPYHYYVRGGEDHSFWSFTQPTPWFGKPPRFDPQALLLNVLTAVCIAALVACPCELWIRRNGRLFRFGTRSVLVVTTMVAVIMGLVAQDVRRSYRQQQAIRELEQLGFVTAYRRLQKYDWFRSFLGADVHGAVHGVDLHATEPVDRLPDLRQLENLESLGLELANIPENIEQLAGLPKLGHLSVKLTSLDGVNPERFTELTSLPELWRLSLVGDEFDDTHIQRISRNTRLGSLEIDSSKITDEGLGRLGEMSSLVTLEITSSNITDEGLARITENSSLVNLTLDESVIKTLDCSILTRLPKLYRLSFVGTNLPAQDVAKLRSQWPNAKFESGTAWQTSKPYIGLRME